MAHLYLNESLEPEAFSVGQTVSLTGEEARHAVTVSRLRVGQRTSVGNGRGSLGSGDVVAADPSRVEVLLTKVTHAAPHTPSLVLVQALAKGDRDERAIEMATEFGADAIVPWQAERSVSRWVANGLDKSAKGHLKFTKIAREASKQSLRAVLPEVRELVLLPELLDWAGRPSSQLFVLHPGAELSLAEAARTVDVSSLTECVCVIGPEGGLSDGEIAQLRASGATVVSLGETVLRTSSAGPAALAVLNVALGRW